MGATSYGTLAQQGTIQPSILGLITHYHRPRGIRRTYSFVSPVLLLRKYRDLRTVFLYC